MMRRLPLPLLTLAVLLPAGPATWAGPPPKPKPQVIDPAGDSLGALKELDVVSVLYSTKGTGTGRKYVPSKLVVTLTLAGAPATSGAVAYIVTAETDDCGTVALRWTPGTTTGGLIGDTYASFGDCKPDGTNNYLFVAARITATGASWTFSLKQVKMRRGTEFSEFRVSVDFVDPATGTTGTDLVEPARGPGDKAAGDGVWKVG